MGGPENCYFPLIYVVKCPDVGGWVVQKSLKTPLRNIKMAPKMKSTIKLLHLLVDGTNFFKDIHTSVFCFCIVSVPTYQTIFIEYLGTAK